MMCIKKNKKIFSGFFLIKNKGTVAVFWNILNTRKARQISRKILVFLTNGEFLKTILFFASLIERLITK